MQLACKRPHLPIAGLGSLVARDKRTLHRSPWGGLVGAGAERLSELDQPAGVSL